MNAEHNDGWRPIETAPARRLVYLKGANGSAPPIAFLREGRRWVGVVFAPLGRRRVYWDESDERVVAWRPA